MFTHLFDLEQLWRVSVIVGTCVLLVPAGWTWLEKRSSMDPDLRDMTPPMIAFGMLVIGAMLINMISPDSPTWGTKFLSVSIWSVAIWAWRRMVRIIRRSRAYLR